MSPLISLELRWFLGGDSFARLDAWFREQLPGSDAGPVDERDDIYLHQPEVEDASIKLRQGKLEIKWREFARPHEGADGLAGQIEQWVKWGWQDPNGPGAEDIRRFGFPTGPWLTVAKKRAQRKYRWDNARFVPEPAKDVLEYGAAVEVTSLALHGRAYSTVLVETFAPDQKTRETILDAALEDLCRNFPRPLPSPDQSYGYPYWLGRFGGA